VFPDADKGADPAVSAEQGGKGFTGQGWETNTNYDLIGDPRAVKGGMIRDVEADFPSTLRPYGPNITSFNTTILPRWSTKHCSFCIPIRWITFRGCNALADLTG
jgi:hypothetical protein